MRNFLSLYYRRKAIVLRLIFNFRSIICQVVAYGRLKNKRKFQTFSSKSGRGLLREVVAYKRFQI